MRIDIHTNDLAGDVEEISVVNSKGYPVRAMRLMFRPDNGMDVSRSGVVFWIPENLMKRNDMADALDRIAAAFRVNTSPPPSPPEWHSVNNLVPPRNTEVEVCGYSGYIFGQSRFLSLAQLDEHNRWVSSQLELLSDNDLTPEYWRFPERLP